MKTAIMFLFFSFFLSAQVWQDVYELYQPNWTDHFYTTSQQEVSQAVNTMGYTNNGVVYQWSLSSFFQSVPIYRLWHNYDHFYTTSLVEKNNAVQRGYTDEGIVGYLQTQTANGFSGWRRLYHPTLDDHAYCINEQKIGQLISQGYLDEGVHGYVKSGISPPTNQSPNTFWVEQPQTQYSSSSITFRWRGTDDRTPIVMLSYHVVITGTSGLDFWTTDTIFSWTTGVGTHSITITARDEDGLLDPTPLQHSFDVQSVQQLPQAPFNISAQGVNQKIVLSWQSTDPNTNGFRIIRDSNQQIGQVVNTVHIFIDSLVVTGRSYQYTIRAFNNNGYTDGQPIIIQLIGTLATENGFNYPVGYPDFTNGWFDAQPFGSVLYVADKFHSGADLNKQGGDWGEPIYSLSQGVIVYKTNNSNSWGKCLVVRYTAPPGYYYHFPDGTKKNIVYFLFAHLNEILVQGENICLSYDQIICGQTTVKKGWQLGTVGEAPGSSGPHLHLECWSEFNGNNPLGLGYYSLLPIFKYDPLEFIANNRVLGNNFTIYCHNYNQDQNSSTFFNYSANWLLATGYQRPSTTPLGYNNYLFYSPTNQLAEVEWRFNIPANGEYDLYVYVPNYGFTTTRAWYNLVRGQSGPLYLYLDGSNKSNKWVKLGRYFFRSDMSNYLVLTSSTTENPAQLVAADAIKLVGQLDMGGYTNIQTEAIPNHFKVSSYPNPFNGQTKIILNLTRAQNISVNIYNLLGQKVAAIFNDYSSVGEYQFFWPDKYFC